MTTFELDLDMLATEKPNLVTCVYNEVWEEFYAHCGSSNEPPPILPVKTFDIPRFTEALQELEKRPHYGMVAMVATDTTMVSVEDKDVDPVANYISRHGVYVLVGGFGGLGLSIAQYLVENGATKLAFLSRSGPKTAEAREILTTFKERGVQVGDYRVDVCDAKEMNKIMGIVRDGAGTVLGVVQCAAVVRVSLGYACRTLPPG
jgi:zearalenone synthase (highly reducing iterative type I polyketide synthase)